MAGTNRKQNQNEFEFVFLKGQEIDQPISLNRPCRRFSFVAPANNGADDQFLIVFISFEKTNMDSPKQVNQIPNNLLAFPLYQSRLLSSGVNGVSPSVEFRCPFTEFFVSFWAINTGTGAITDLAGALICSEDDLKQIITYPAPIINVG